MLELNYRREAIVVRIQAPTLDVELLDGLAAAIAYIGPERPIILTGVGDVFAPDLDPLPETRNRLSEVLGALRRHPLPVVAAINGDTIGAGYALAEAADVRIMAGGVIQPSATRLDATAAVAAGLVELHCAPARLLGLALRLACPAQGLVSVAAG